MVSNWVTQIIQSQPNSGRRSNNNLLNNSSNVIFDNQVPDRDNSFLNNSEYPIPEELLKYETLINSNNFNAFELHKETKNNSMYFML